MNKNEYNEFVNRVKSREHFAQRIKCIRENLYGFLIGNDCSLTDKNTSLIDTDPWWVVEYLNICVCEGTTTNENINSELSKIDISKKENVWLLLMYIEEQVCRQQFDYYKVKIDVPMIEKMLEKADPALKDDYTVKYIKRETKEKYGYEINF